MYCNYFFISLQLLIKKYNIFKDTLILIVQFQAARYFHNNKSRTSRRLLNSVKPCCESEFFRQLVTGAVIKEPGYFAVFMDIKGEFAVEIILLLSNIL